MAFICNLVSGVVSDNYGRRPLIMIGMISLTITWFILSVLY